MSTADSADPPEPTFFFVHVMKTGGTTFIQHLEATFPANTRYPQAQRGVDRQRAYYMIDELRQLTAEQRKQIRVYSGHFPFVAAVLVEADVTMTILRDPVERSISYLRHCKRYHAHHKHLSLEEIYEDDWIYKLYIHNYQAKLFAMTPDDKLESHLDEIDIDEARLRTAVANLEQVDVLGLSDRYDEFVDEVRRRYGWRINTVRKLRVSKEGWDVSEAFRRRIAADNEADLMFYDFARREHDRRHKSTDGRSTTSRN